MHYTPDSKAIEALGDRTTVLPNRSKGLRTGSVRRAELRSRFQFLIWVFKGVTHRLGTASGAAERTLAWLEQEVMCALKGVGQSLLAGLCELQVTRGH